MLRRNGPLIPVMVLALSAFALSRSPAAVRADYSTGMIFDKRRIPVSAPAGPRADNSPDEYVIPWRVLQTYIGTLSFDLQAGEPNHILQPIVGGREVRASIQPTANVWNVGADVLAKGYVIARINADGAYPRLGIHPGNNYLVVWRNARRLSGMVDSMGIISAAGRMRLPFEFKIHPAVPATEREQTFGTDFNTAREMLGGGAPALANIQGLASLQTTALSGSVLTCKNRGWRACFIDSADEQIRTVPPAGPMLPLHEHARPDGSEPWISCMIFGCCCGGGQCHTGQ